MTLDIEKEAERRALRRFRAKAGEDAAVPVEGQCSLAMWQLWQSVYRDVIDDIAKEAKNEAEPPPGPRTMQVLTSCLGSFLLLVIVGCGLLYLMWRLGSPNP